jgi:hypothetical protein
MLHEVWWKHAEVAPMTRPAKTIYGESIPVGAHEGYECARDARRDLEAAQALVLTGRASAQSFGVKFVGRHLVASVADMLRSDALMADQLTYGAEFDDAPWEAVTTALDDVRQRIEARP